MTSAYETVILIVYPLVRIFSRGHGSGQETVGPFCGTRLQTVLMRSARSAAKKGQEIMDELLSEIIGDLGIICMPGCESFVDRVQYYLKQWNGSEVDDYIVNGVISRFSTGEAKGFLRETVRGKDLYFITDCFN